MSNKEKDDLTRIEDLSDYLHNDDSTNAEEISNEDEEKSEDTDDSKFPPSFPTNLENDDMTSSTPEEEVEPSFTASFDENSDDEFTKEEESEEYDFDSPASITSDQEEFNKPTDENESESFNTGHTESFNEDALDHFEAPTPDNSDHNFETQDEIIAEESSENLTKETDIVTPPAQKNNQPVKFDDVRNFAKNINLGTIPVSGNPPFALALKNIKYKEDADDILRILKEYDLVKPDNETIYKQGLENRSVLISQISEYAAIVLAHKFRRFTLDIEFGPSTEIHKSKTYNDESKGLISKHNLKQNKTDHINLQNNQTGPDSIILSTTATLQNYEIIKYIDLITVTTTITDQEFNNFNSEDTFTIEKIDAHIQGTDIEENKKEYNIKLSDIYSHLSTKLKDKAFKKGGNAVIGISYQTTPLTQNKENTSNYKITCSGNIVLVAGS